MDSEIPEKVHFSDSIGLSFYEHDMKFASGVVEEKPTQHDLPEQEILIDHSYQNGHKVQIKEVLLNINLLESVVKVVYAQE